nr:MAG TPA: hypothetical protein [Caudoviricetes sp.]
MAVGYGLAPYPTCERVPTTLHNLYGTTTVLLYLLMCKYTNIKSVRGRLKGALLWF